MVEKFQHHRYNEKFFFIAIKVEALAFFRHALRDADEQQI